VNLWVIPPLADFTVRRWAQGSDDWQVLDLTRQFAERCLDAATLEGWAAEQAEGGPERGLHLKVASDLLQNGATVHTRLRALGSAFRGACGRNSSVRLRLDDLELAQGSTERSTDVEAAADVERLPFGPELTHALDLAKGATRVRLELVSDTQLPAAVALARSLSQALPLELTGVFAQAHGEALRTIASFRRASISPQGLGASIAGFGTRLAFGEEGADWDGRVVSGRQLQTGSSLGPGCRVFRFCRLSPNVLEPDGESCAVDELFNALQGVPRETRVIGEWWLGAPGVSEADVHTTAELLAKGFPFSALAGVRPFHWHIQRPKAGFDGAEVRWTEPDSTRDLLRSRPFQADHPVSGVFLESLMTQLSAHCTMVPGRLAGAYSTPTSSPLGPGALVALDPDASIVTLPAALDGKKGPVSYAANLRTGVVMAVDPRLVPALRSLRSPATPDQALPQVPGPQREKVLETLVRKTVLARVRA
jgi:hypothetical protein